VRVSELSKFGVGPRHMGIPAFWYWRVVVLNGGCPWSSGQALAKDFLRCRTARASLKNTEAQNLDPTEKRKRSFYWASENVSPENAWNFTYLRHIERPQTQFCLWFLCLCFVFAAEVSFFIFVKMSKRPRR
jgi:hypothetical protein